MKEFDPYCVISQKEGRKATASQTVRNYFLFLSYEIQGETRHRLIL